MPPFERVQTRFFENFDQLGELGASVSIWHRGVEVLSLAAGYADRERTQPWTEDSACVVWSATKGPTAACVLKACELASASPDLPVATFWPEFAAAGKEAVTLRELLSHQAGLAVAAAALPIEETAAIADSLAAQAPIAPFRTGCPGYHPRTFGPLMERVIERLSGQSVGAFWRRHFAEPLGLSFWIGRPENLAESACPVFPPVGPPPQGDPFYTAYGTPGSAVHGAFTRLRGLTAVSAMNLPANQAAGYAAFGGVGTARGLAKFYASLQGDGPDFASSSLQQLDWCTTTASTGVDATLMTVSAFSAGFMKDPEDADGHKLRHDFGPSRLAFGHPGAGGSMAFLDPENHIAFAYVMNQMTYGVLPNRKSVRLVEALYEELLTSSS